MRETSRRYDVSFTYPPACFPRRSSWDNSIEFVGEGTEFASWSLSEQFDEDNLQAFARRADEASPPAQPWLPALLKAPLIRGSSNVEIVYALAPATRP